MNKNKLTLFLILFYFSLLISKSQKVDTDFYNELKEELTDIIAEKFWAKEYSDKYAKHIEKTTKRAVRKRFFDEAKNHIKNQVYNLNKPLILEGLHNKFFVYKVPKWPIYSQPFMQKNIFHVDMDLDWVNRSFYSGGEKQDLSNLLFRQENLTIKDILLVSKLMKEEIVEWVRDNLEYNKFHYFYILADQPLIFDASYNKQTINLNLAHHFMEGSFSIGLKIPVVRRSNKIKLISEISVADRDLLQIGHYRPEEICGGHPPNAPNFFEKYGNLENFFIDILDQKDIKFNKNDTEIGLGDFSLFLNFEFEWKEAEQFLTGVNFIIPMANGRDIKKLWNPELGNGGFYYLEPFVSVLFSESRWFNPHVFFSAKIGLPAKVNRRVPKLISYDGITPRNGEKASGLMIYGNKVFVRGENYVFTDELDSKAKRLSDEFKRTNIVPGARMFLRLGNMFERFLYRKAFLDMYYDFSIKLKDYTRGWLNSEEYKESIITDNSWYLENKIGINYSYQIDEHFRLNCSFLYTFAGTNVEELFRLNLGLSAEF